MAFPLGRVEYTLRASVLVGEEEVVSPPYVLKITANVALVIPQDAERHPATTHRRAAHRLLHAHCVAMSDEFVYKSVVPRYKKVQTMVRAHRRAPHRSHAPRGRSRVRRRPPHHRFASDLHGLASVRQHPQFVAHASPAAASTAGAVPDVRRRPPTRRRRRSLGSHDLATGAERDRLATPARGARRSSARHQRAHGTRPLSSTVGRLCS